MSEPRPDPSEGSGQPGPVIRDRRRLDPETGRVREAYASTAPAAPAADQPGAAGQPGPAGSTGQPAQPGGAGVVPDKADPNRAEANGTSEEVSLDGILADLDAAQASAAERLSDLQRVQAEFVNYRRRVDRDRDVARDQAVAGILEALLPVLDDVHLARQHGDLDGGPFAAIAEKLESVLQRFGLARYGEPGEAFDPAVHEALMHTEAELAEGTTTTTVVQVLQPGYRTGDRVLRAARVAVADPQ
jgi:molecular chaperone GrpE